MKRVMRCFLSIFLSVAVAVTMVPSIAFAVGDEGAGEWEVTDNSPSVACTYADDYANLDARDYISCEQSVMDTLTYQWYSFKDGEAYEADEATLLKGETSPQLKAKPNARNTYYMCEVSSENRQSNIFFTLSLPYWGLYPYDGTQYYTKDDIQSGKVFTMTTYADSHEGNEEDLGLTYQWYSVTYDEQGNDTSCEVIPEATKPYYSTPVVSGVDGYKCVATDKYGISDYVYMDLVLDPGWRLWIRTDDGDSDGEYYGFFEEEIASGKTLTINTVCESTEGEPITSGISYQWYSVKYDENDDMVREAIPNATGPSYTFKVSENEDSYECVATDREGHTQTISVYTYVRDPWDARAKDDRTGIYYAEGTDFVDLEVVIDSYRDPSEFQLQYKWSELDKDTDEYVDIEGANGASLHAPAKETEYMCTVRDKSGVESYITFTLKPFGSETVISDDTAYISLDGSTYDYTGAAIKPPVEVYLYNPAEETYDELSDEYYTVEYSNNINVGIATVTVTGKNGFTGSVTDRFTINALNISKATVTGVEDAVYTGAAIEPVPVVTMNGKTLVKGTDYDLEYHNNTAVGNADVTIKGKGNYVGSITKTFKITEKQDPSEGDDPSGTDPVKVTPTVTLAKTKLVYNGKVQKPAATVKVDGNKLAEDSYDIAYSRGCKLVGTYTATVTLKGDYEGSASAKYQIVPKKPVISKATAGKKKMTVKMKTKASKTGGKSYQIAYKVKGTKKWKVVTTTKQSQTIKKLKKGKKYQVKVRAFKKVGKTKIVSAWSKVKTTKKIK